MSNFSYKFYKINITEDYYEAIITVFHIIELFNETLHIICYLIIILNFKILKHHYLLTLMILIIRD